MDQDLFAKATLPLKPWSVSDPGPLWALMLYPLNPSPSEFQPFKTNSKLLHPMFLLSLLPRQPQYKGGGLRPAPRRGAGRLRNSWIGGWGCSRCSKNMSWNRLYYCNWQRGLMRVWYKCCCRLRMPSSYSYARISNQMHQTIWKTVHIWQNADRKPIVYFPIYLTHPSTCVNIMLTTFKGVE